jgi:hypothetical protein
MTRPAREFWSGGVCKRRQMLLRKKTLLLVLEFFLIRPISPIGPVGLLARARSPDFGFWVQPPWRTRGAGALAAWRGSDGAGGPTTSPLLPNVATGAGGAEAAISECTEPGWGTVFSGNEPGIISTVAPTPIALKRDSTSEDFIRTHPKLAGWPMYRSSGVP